MATGIGHDGGGRTRRGSRAAPWPEMVALGDELRRSCSLAAAGNRGEAEEGHGRRRLRGARRRRSRGAATVARERDGGIGLLGVCVVANKKKEAALAGNREGEMHGLGLQWGAAGPLEDGWAGLLWARKPSWAGLKERKGKKGFSFFLFTEKKQEQKYLFGGTNKYKLS